MSNVWLWAHFPSKSFVIWQKKQHFWHKKPDFMLFHDFSASKPSSSARNEQNITLQLRQNSGETDLVTRIHQNMTKIGCFWAFSHFFIFWGPFFGNFEPQSCFFIHDFSASQPSWSVKDEQNTTLQVRGQLSVISCQIVQLSDRTAVKSDNCQWTMDNCQRKLSVLWKNCKILQLSPLGTVAIYQRLVVAGGGFFLLLDLGPGAAACGGGWS